MADVEADGHIMDALRRCGAVAIASSEEQPRDLPLGGSGYSVAFDPLDGSSIIGANWAVGWVRVQLRHATCTFCWRAGHLGVRAVAWCSRDEGAAEVEWDEVEPLGATLTS